MTKNIRVLFISQEITPYLPETEISIISRYLPQATQERGREIRTFMPKYSCINERRNQLHEVIRLSGMNLIIDDTDHPLIIKVASIQAARMQVYFIDNEDYFPRKSSFGDCSEEAADFLNFDNNEERSIFFIRGVLETVRKLRWTPDIVHCHGWLTALAPLYIKKAYNDEPSFRNAKIVYSLYENVFDKPFDKSFSEKLLLNGIKKEHLKSISKVIDCEALNKLAIDFSDGVVQGSTIVNNVLWEYAHKAKKLLLPYQDSENYINAYNDFYDKITK